jgi:hypothetical protein
MSRVKQDKSREERIDMEIVVDAYNEDERAMGWYYYLDNNLNVPFKAKWVAKKGSASAYEGEEVEVWGMADEQYCEEEMFVEVAYQEDGVEDSFSVPLYEIEPTEADSKTAEAVADWHYWVNQGYEF